MWSLWSLVTLGLFRSFRQLQSSPRISKEEVGEKLTRPITWRSPSRTPKKNTIQGSSLGIDPPCKLLTLCFQIRSLQFSLTLTANSQRTRSYSIFAQKLASQAECIPTSTTRNVCASPYEIKTFRSSVGQVMAENNCKPGKMQIFQQWSAVGGNRKRDTRERICGISSPTNHRARSDLRFSPPKTSIGRVDCFRTFDL